MNSIKSAIVQNSRYGVKDRCLEFDGTTSNYMQVPNHSSLQITGAITIEGWYEFGAGGATETLFGKGRMATYPEDSTACSYGMNIVSSTRLRFRIVAPNPYPRRDLFFNDFKDDENYITGFNHIVCVWDGTTDDDGMKIYLNGVLVASRASTITSLKVSTEVLSIGCDRQRPTNERFNFTGKIDEVRIWNHARTPEQIKRYMHTRLIGNPALHEGLVAYYPMDKLREVDMTPDPPEFYTDDYSQNSNHGLVVGATQITP